MPYVCGKCNHFDAEAERGAACSSCGGNMHFTMLDPGATATATLDEPSPEAWKNPYVYGFDEIEASPALRYAQIGLGISAYFGVSRFLRVLFFLGLADLPMRKAILAIAFAMFVANCFAALIGGAVSGFRVRNWIPQGLGVAGGILIIPLVLMLFFAPENWPLFCITLAVTSVLATIGAYLGHRFVRPIRVPRS